MCARYLGLVLLVWFPGVLHAQSAPQSCSAPSLNAGFLVPQQDVYSHETTLHYACNKGFKPAAEGWWATITCQDGTWSHKPQCIDKKACIPLDIPNGKDIENHRGWYEDRFTISITCNVGYDPKSREVTCEDGVWTPVPVCEKSLTACGAPPPVPHAVIILQRYQELFAANSRVQYECEDGYTVEGGDAPKNITCRAGEWTRLPTCSAGRAASAEVETVGGPATSPDSRTQPASGGSSTSSGTNDRDGSSRAPISRCGVVPVIPNAVVLEEKRTFVKYKCSVYYTQVGPEIVYCNSNGRWTQQPTCEVPFCELDPAPYNGYFSLSAVERITEGQEKIIPCGLWPNTVSRVQCVNGQIVYHQCQHPQ